MLQTKKRLNACYHYVMHVNVKTKCVLWNKVTHVPRTNLTHFVTEHKTASTNLATRVEISLVANIASSLMHSLGSALVSNLEKEGSNL